MQQLKKSGQAHICIFASIVSEVIGIQEPRNSREVLQGASLKRSALHVVVAGFQRHPQTNELVGPWPWFWWGFRLWGFLCLHLYLPLTSHAGLKRFALVHPPLPWHGHTSDQKEIVGVEKRKVAGLLTKAMAFKESVIS